MKYTLYILFFIPFASFGQLYQVSPAEYTCGIVRTDIHQMWAIVGDTLTLPNTPPCVLQVASGAHGQMIIACDSTVWYQGDNLSGEGGQGNTSPITGFAKITTDSIGNPFKNVIQVLCAGTTSTNPYYSLALKSDGTLWVWGITRYGISGDGTGGALTTTRPIQVPFPAGTFITKIQGSIFIQVVDSAGNEWRWGANFGFFAQYLLGQGTGSPITNSPTKVTFPGTTSRVVDIAAGGTWCFSLMANGRLYASTYFGIYAIVGSGPYTSGPAASTTPFRVDTATGLPAAIRHIYCNNNGTFFILVDSTLWFAGDNSNGNAGDGTELNYAIYTTNPAPYGGTTPFVYAWDQDASTCQYPYRKPHQIAPGKHNFVSVFVTTSINYCAWAIDAYDNLYAWGRGKGGVLGDQLFSPGSNIDGIYPNGTDRPYITKVNPFQNTVIPVTCPYCITHPSGSPCNTYTNVATTPPTARVVANVSGNRVVLNATTSTDAHFINYYEHKQLTGTALSNPIRANSTDTLYNVPVGSYSFQAKVTNNGWLSDSTTVSFTVLPSSSIQISPGQKIIAH